MPESGPCLRAKNRPSAVCRVDFCLVTRIKVGVCAYTVSMVDPTSDLEEDVDESNAPECATCGAKIIRSPTHVVVTWIEEGAVQRRHFCDADCRAEWDGADRSGA